MKPKQIRF